MINAAVINAEELIADVEGQKPELRTWASFEQLVQLVLWRDLQQSVNESRRKKGKDVKVITPAVMFEAMSILDPSQREFWLRCEATANERWIKGMTAFFEMDVPEEPK